VSQDVVRQVLLPQAHGLTVSRASKTNPQISSALWKRAYDSLRDKDRAVLDKNTKSTLDQLQNDIKTRIEQTKGAPVKLPNGEQFFVRDVFRTISHWVKMFVEVGDTAAQFDPVHAAPPWAALRALLKVRLRVSSPKRFIC
jgi:hypothetical protein